MIWYAPNAVKPHNMHNNHASRIRFLKKVETFYISHGSVVTFYVSTVDKCMRTNVKCLQDSV